MIQVHRRYLVELMQQWTRIKEDEADFDLGLALVVDAELFRLDSVIRWLDAADGRISGPRRWRARLRPVGRTASADGSMPAAWGAAMSALELREVSKTYGEGPEVHALRGVDLAVEAGRAGGGDGTERLRQVHPADHRRQPGGSDSGEVLVGGRALARMSRNDKARLRRRTIGYVFQDFNLLAGLTAAETLPCRWSSTGRRPAQARAAALCVLDDLGSRRADRFPDQLSGGERQRVASPARSSASAACCSPTSRRARSTRSTARRSCG